jgi:glutamyl-Q tRNA(Asp) synthetase
MTTPIFRFAPSPNGPLHLGHALSALWNQKLAEQRGGQCLLRIEDIDQTRCRPEFVVAAKDDLHWLGLRWPEPVMHQSSRFACYRAALDDLQERHLLYPCFCTRSQLAQGAEGRATDPDGTPLYDQRCLALSPEERDRRKGTGKAFAMRLNMRAALAMVDPADLWFEDGRIDAEPRSALAHPAVWGDVVLARKDIGTSYHLSVVVDDAAQGITDVVRGMDLHRATDLHVLLQRLLRLPTPRYVHHPLVMDEAGQKLSKSRGSTGLADLRRQGLTAKDIRRQLGFEP